jgi:hypothetical protein
LLHVQGRDPEAYHSVRNMHTVRRKIQETVDLTVSTTTKIHELDAEFVTLSTTVLSQPSPETILQLKAYKEDLKARLGQIHVIFLLHLLKVISSMTIRIMAFLLSVLFSEGNKIQLRQ